MPYAIDKFNGSPLTTVDDGTLNQTLDIKLIGKNYAGYGEVQNENMVHLLEHFANSLPPPRKIEGQLWYDTSTKKLKVYTSSGWKSLASAENSSTAPTSPNQGDTWYDTVNGQLKAWTGTQWITIGPESAGTGVTRLVSSTVTDDSDASRAIIEAKVNNKTVFVIYGGNAPFSLKSGETLLSSGFDVIRRGITLVDTESAKGGVTRAGVTQITDDFQIHGTATSSRGLVVGGTFVPAADFVQTGDTIGSSSLATNLAGGAAGSIPYQSGTGSTDFLSAGVAGQVLQSEGSAAPSWITATANNTPSTIVKRDASGNFSANVITATTTEARYADLAEIYATDQHYQVGTVVMVGGEKEVTACTVGSRAIGVISQNPAYIMNSMAEGQPIALKGRVPVFVQGVVLKGQKLVAASNGTAQVGQGADVFAIALESSQDSGVKLVEAIVL